MSTTTTNYSLKKPEITDYVSDTIVNDLPDNFDAIDTLLKALADAMSVLTGTDIALDTTNFTSNLSASIDSVQKLADAVDDLLINTTGAGVSLSTAGFTGNLDASIDTVQKLANAVDGLSLEHSPSASAIQSGTIDLANDIYMVNSDSSVSVGADGVSITGGKFSYSNASGVPIIDDYGIDPIHFDYFKNMVKNSGFERFDPSNGVDYPLHWTGGMIQGDSSFYGTFSCELSASASVETNSNAYINPNDYDNAITRVSFHRKLGQMKLEVYDVTNSQYFTLTDEDGNSGASITYDATSNWDNSRASARFDPTQHGACTQLKIVITNVHASQTGYVDAVMLTPDANGKYPQIYKAGASSDSIQIVVSDTSPTDITVLWFDTSS